MCIISHCTLCYQLDTIKYSAILNDYPGKEQLMQELQELSITQQNSVIVVKERYLQALKDPAASDECIDALALKLSELTQSFHVLRQSLLKVSKIFSLKPNLFAELIQFELQKYQQGLPAYRLKLEFVEEVKNLQNNFCLVVGETGSGKSTQLPQFFYSEFIRGLRGSIICVQPRKIAALSLAKRMSEELHDELGGVVGYDFGNKDKKFSEKTRITLMTEKVFLDKVIKDRERLAQGEKKSYFSFVGAVLLDEVHERSITIDLIMGMLKETVQIHKKMKVIICSATVNENLFTSYFNQCKVIRIKGRAYPVEEQYQPVNGTEGYIDGAFNAITQICEQNKKGTFLYHGHILVFLLSVEEMETLSKLLRTYFNENNIKDNYVIHFLHGKLDQEDQQKVFKPEEENKIKIILATKIAECSITINGVRVVIDSGKDKDAYYDSSKKMNVLETKYISQAAANQRRGRAGRTSPGICYRLYSQDELAQFDSDNKPEIKKLNLEEVILKIKQAGWLNVFEFPFFERPEQINLQNAHEILRLLQATNADGTLTDEGIVMTKLPTNPSKSKAIIQAFQRGCLEEILKVISLETFSSYLYKKIDRKSSEQPMVSKFITELKTKQSDHLMYLELMNQWGSLTFPQRKEWCKEHSLNMKAFSSAMSLHQELKLSVYKLTNFSVKHPCITINEVLSKEDLSQRILKCLFASYYMSVSRELLTRNFIYQGLFASSNFRINNSSALARIYLTVLQKQNFLVIFSEMISLPNFNLASNVSTINPDYLRDKSIISQALIEECQRKQQELTNEEMKTYTFAKGTLTQLMKIMNKKMKEITTSFQNRGIQTDTKYDYDNGVFAALYSKTKDGILETQFVNEIETQIVEFRKQQRNQKLVVQFEGTPIRAVFDSEFNIQELVFEHEFIQVSLKGLPTNISNEVLIQRLGIDKSFLTSYYTKEFQVKGKPQTSLQLSFTSKVLAKEFLDHFQILQYQFQSVSCLPHYQRMQNLNEKNILKATWCIGQSKCKATIYYENEADPENALEYINGRVIDNCSVRARINSKNPKNLELEGLSPLTDEQTLKLFVGGVYSQPKIMVHRDEPKSKEGKTYGELQFEGDTFVSQFNESFEELLLSNSLGDMITRMTIEYSANKKFIVNAIIYLNSEKEGEDLVNKYDGKAGVIGTQKLRLQVKSKFVLKYSDPKIFEVLKEELCERIVLLQSQNQNSLFIQVKRDAIVIQGIDSQVSRKAASQIDLLCQGKILYIEKYILDKHFNIIKQAVQNINYRNSGAFKSDCVFLKRKDQCNVQIVAKNKDIERQVEEQLDQCIAEFKKQQKAMKDEQKAIKRKGKQGGSKLQQQQDTCEICYECISPQSMYVLSCQHKFCLTCIEGHIESTEQKFKIVCPGGCPGLIQLNDIREIYSENSQAQALYQKSIKSYINSQGSLKPCFTPNCPQVYEWKPDQDIFDCSVCFEKWCVRDLSKKAHKVHPKQSCDDILVKPDVGIRELEASGLVKRCPSCRTPIFKDQGCNHMTCNKCPAHFCWRCGQGFENASLTYTHLNEKHGGIYDR